MRLVIDMDDSEYKEILKDRHINYLRIIKAIKNGTPLPKLPKGIYGDLVTKEQMIELVEFYKINPQHFDFANLIDEIKDEKPIIETESEE